MLQLELEGFPCTSISGQLDNVQRDAVIKEFRTGITKVLIATDVLARGFDVQQVSIYVILLLCVVCKWPHMVTEMLCCPIISSADLITYKCMGMLSISIAVEHNWW